MGVRRYHDLLAWHLADAFKTEVYRLLDCHKVRLTSWKLREQLADAAGAVPKDISEGFIRFSPAQFARFLDYALASLVEAEQWLRDAVERGFLTAEHARHALSLAKRCWNVSLALKRSQEREIQRRRQRGKTGGGRKTGEGGTESKGRI
jgi:four helix bundle protein